MVRWGNEKVKKVNSFFEFMEFGNKRERIGSICFRGYCFFLGRVRT